MEDILESIVELQGNSLNRDRALLDICHALIKRVEELEDKLNAILKINNLVS